MNGIAILIAAIVLVGCGTEGRDRLVISAASSLTEVFTVAEREFEDIHPDIDIDLNVAGSGTLVNQVVEGAPVSIIVTADRIALDPIVDLVVDTEDIATNRLVLIHRTDRLPDVDSLVDIDDDAIVVACDIGAPCGRVTSRVLDDLDAALAIDSFESNVRAVRQRVVSGEADAGFVYRSDVPDEPDIGDIEFESEEASSTVVVATLGDSAQIRLFLDFVRTGGVDGALLDRGFELR